MKLTEAEQKLLARLRAQPALQAQVEGLLDEIENEAGQSPTADQAEELVVTRIRAMGREAMTAWAQRRHEQLGERPAGARQGAKKKSAG